MILCMLWMVFIGVLFGVLVMVFVYVVIEVDCVVWCVDLVVLMQMLQDDYVYLVWMVLLQSGVDLLVLVCVVICVLDEVYDDVEVEQVLCMFLVGFYDGYLVLFDC